MLIFRSKTASPEIMCLLKEQEMIPFGLADLGNGIQFNNDDASKFAEFIGYIGLPNNLIWVADIAPSEKGSLAGYCCAIVSADITSDIEDDDIKRIVRDADNWIPLGEVKIKRRQQHTHEPLPKYNNDKLMTVGVRFDSFKNLLAFLKKWPTLRADLYTVRESYCLVIDKKTIEKEEEGEVDFYRRLILIADEFMASEILTEERIAYIREHGQRVGNANDLICKF